MKLAAVGLIDDFGSSRDVLVRNYDGTEAPSGDKHIARFMRANKLSVCSIHIVDCENFEEGLTKLASCSYIFRNEARPLLFGD